MLVTLGPERGGKAVVDALTPFTLLYSEEM